MITASAAPLGAPRGLFVVAARTQTKKCGKLAIFVQTKAHWSKANTNAARSHNTRRDATAKANQLQCSIWE